MQEQNLSLEYEKNSNQQPIFLRRLKKLNQTSKKKRVRQNKCRKRFKKAVYRRVFKDQSFYKGQIQGNLRHGFGKHQYADGSFYVGQYKNGKRHGYGEYKDKTGQNRYWGEYKKGYRDGKGKLIAAHKYTYEGNFKQGKFHGFGKIQFLDKSYYQGIFEKGRWSKKGTYVDKNGNVYKLAFDNQNDPQMEMSIKEWMILKELTDFLPLSMWKSNRKQKS